jgi:hypothetical protein
MIYTLSLTLSRRERGFIQSFLNELVDKRSARVPFRVSTTRNMFNPAFH